MVKRVIIVIQPGAEDLVQHVERVLRSNPDVIELSRAYPIALRRQLSMHGKKVGVVIRTARAEV